MEQKKPWYQSKIIMLGAALVAAFGSNLLTGWLSSNGVTPEQMESLQLAYPDIVEGVEKMRSGENILSAIGMIGGAVIIVVRRWFTVKLLG